MTSDNVPMQDPIDQNGVADEAVKPKRTRRPKAAAETAVTPEAQVSAPRDDVAPAPVKAPRKRKVETVEAVAPAVAEVAEVADAPKPKRAPRKKADAAVSDVAESSAPREAAANGFLQLGPDAGSDGAAQAQPAVQTRDQERRRPEAGHPTGEEADRAEEAAKLGGFEVDS